MPRRWGAQHHAVGMNTTHQRELPSGGKFHQPVGAERWVAFVWELLQLVGAGWKQEMVTMATVKWNMLLDQQQQPGSPSTGQINPQDPIRYGSTAILLCRAPLTGFCGT
jgi:hypothetical protein